ncbi:MAG: SRPBCC family protein [Chloroflexota bacterium]
MNDTHSNIYQIYIQTTADKLWEALTTGDITQQYYFATRVESDWKAGSPYAYNYDTGEPMVKGQLIEVDPPKRLVKTFQPVFAQGEGGQHVSKVTFEIEDFDGTCKLKLIHDDLDPSHPLSKGLMEGWTQIISSLKTLLETGQAMPM